MSKVLRLRDGTTTQHAGFTGASSEITFDLTKKVPVAHDGATAGGFPLLGENNTQTVKNKTFDNSNSYTFRLDRVTLQDSADVTKQAAFSAAGITAGTTRTYTLPNVSATLAHIGSDAQTFAGTLTFSAASGSYGTSTDDATYSLGGGATASGKTKTVNVGTGGLSGSTTNINYGSATGTVTHTVNGKLAVNGAINFAPSGSLASGSTVNIGAVASNNVTITGTTTITAFDTVAEGVVRIVKFAGILTLTHNATSLRLPGSANIITAANDVAVMRSLGSGNWECIAYTRNSGKALVESVSSVNGSTGAVTVEPGMSSIVKIVYTTTGANTWTKQAGLKFIVVEVVGGGGGGDTDCSYDSIGASGGYSNKKILAASLGATEAVTVGAAGNSAASPTSGGTSSFGSHCSATGGGTGSTSSGGTSGAAGSGSGGDMNVSGVTGRAGSNTSSQGTMAYSFIGGSTYGRSAKPGVVIVTEYY